MKDNGLEYWLLHSVIVLTNKDNGVKWSSTSEVLLISFTSSAVLYRVNMHFLHPLDLKAEDFQYSASSTQLTSARASKILSVPEGYMGSWDSKRSKGSKSPSGSARPLRSKALRLLTSQIWALQCVTVDILPVDMKLQGDLCWLYNFLLLFSSYGLQRVVAYWNFGPSNGARYSKLTI